MHRSGTSLTAAFVQAMGLELGNNLLPGSYWNPRGYYEDMELVAFSRKVLRECCGQHELEFKEWGWTAQESLNEEMLRFYRQPARELVDRRQKFSQNTQQWGWKDPRTTLLLEFWHQIVSDAKYLLVYRYPWDVTDSILRLNLPFFWQNPDYCLQVWRYYNRHLLRFYQAHDDRCVLVNVHGWLRCPDRFLNLLNHKLSLSLSCSDADEMKRAIAEIYDPQLLSRLPQNHPLIELLYRCDPESFALLDALENVADIPCRGDSLFTPTRYLAEADRLQYEGFERTPDRKLLRLVLKLHQETIKVERPLDSPQFISWLNTAIAAYQKHPQDESKLTQLRQARQQIASRWLATPGDRLQATYDSYLGKAHQLLLDSGFRDEPLTDEERYFLEKLVAEVAKGWEAPQAMQFLLGAMLYRRADQLPLQLTRIAVPQWFLEKAIEFIFYFPSCFHELGEVENYARYMQQLVDLIHHRVVNHQVVNESISKIWDRVARIFADAVNLVPLYFTEQNLKQIYTKRCDILEYLLRKDGYKLDYQFGDRPATRKKIRLGIIKANFTLVSETFTTLPVFEYLDRSQFEIIIYVLEFTGQPLETYCQSRVDKFIKLPKNTHQQVEIIRHDNLDILFFGSIVTNAVHPITLLAHHRLARVQATYFASPVTTGIRHMDYYISGTATEPPEAQTQYREKLALLEGAGFCFNYTIIPDKINPSITRNNLGISENAVAFISGANLFKIIPELRVTWAKILADAPDSVLILYPFGSTWSSDYPKPAFINRITALFEQYGVTRYRLIILDRLADRSQVKQVLALADIYLDSYPYAGANSTVDPLEVGLPTVVKEGNSLRSRQGTALLRELELFDLITNTETDYIQLSIRLAKDAKLRHHWQQKIQQKMQQIPGFLNGRAYGKKMGAMFSRLSL